MAWCASELKTNSTKAAFETPKIKEITSTKPQGITSPGAERLRCQIHQTGISNTRNAVRFPAAQASHSKNEGLENVDIDVAKLITTAKTKDLPSRKVSPPSSLKGKRCVLGEIT
jgi:hypothetical protein